MPAVRAGQRPVLARNDPLNIFGRQRQQTFLIAAAECCKKILHNLDALRLGERLYTDSRPRLLVEGRGDDASPFANVSRLRRIFSPR